MCGTKIEHGKCNCGTWKSAEEMKDHPMLKALEMFHEMKRFTFTSDIPYLGVAMICFRGDYNDCQKVQKFIYKMKNRPFYEEE